jgi:hypothetical protein
VLCSDIPPFREQVSLYKLERYVAVVDGFDEDSWPRAIEKEIHIANQADYASDVVIESFSRWTWIDVAS